LPSEGVESNFKVEEPHDRNPEIWNINVTEPWNDEWFEGDGLESLSPSGLGSVRLKPSPGFVSICFERRQP
jgi:hypothetical protein